MHTNFIDVFNRNWRNFVAGRITDDKISNQINCKDYFHGVHCKNMMLTTSSESRKICVNET